MKSTHIALFFIGLGLALYYVREPYSPPQEKQKKEIKFKSCYRNSQGKAPEKIIDYEPLFTTSNKQVYRDQDK